MAARADAAHWRGAVRIFGVMTMLALAGCGSVSDFGSAAIVPPDNYDYNSCKELLDARNGNASREKELVGLIEKADSGGLGGMIVGATTYRSELAQVRARLEFIAKAERDKRCAAPR